MIIRKRSYHNEKQFLSYLMFFVITSLMLLLNVYGVSADIVYIEDYNHSISLSAFRYPNNILYFARSNGTATLMTTEGTTFNAFKDERTMDDNVINNYNNEIKSGDYEITDDDIQGDPSYSYNCHSYAWYDRSTSNEYWINLPNQFIDDVHCSDELTESQLQPDDIVTYWSYGYYADNDGNLCYGYYCAHSAVVESIENNTIVCISKWGQYGLYRHNIDKVPAEYKYNGEIDTKYYRYTQDEHYFSEIIEDNGVNGHTIKCGANKDNKTCSYTTECDSTAVCTSYNSSKHYVSCSDCGCSGSFDHDLYMYEYNGEDGGIVKCHGCPYTINCYDWLEYEDDGDMGHSITCMDCNYSIFEEHTFEATDEYNSNGHTLECACCDYTVTVGHEYYTYAVYGGDNGCTVKCRICDYSIDCTADPEFDLFGYDGHYVDCVCGSDCFSFAEEHQCNYITQGYGSHLAECIHCTYEAELSHNWIDNGEELVCVDCEETISYSQLNALSDLTDEEIAVLISVLPIEKIETILAALTEEELARITALLPPENEDELLTE